MLLNLIYFLPVILYNAKMVINMPRRKKKEEEEEEEEEEWESEEEEEY